MTALPTEARVPILPSSQELVETTLSLGGTDVTVWSVGDIDALLARMVDAGPRPADDDIPYYAWIWPVSEWLAHQIMAGPPLDGKTVLELGCGHGLAGLCAGLRGALVELTDLQEGALQLARLNVGALKLDGTVTVARLDWRQPQGARVDVILCSDVLYEARFVRPVLDAILARIKPGGVALVADHSRAHFGAFVHAAALRGMDVVDGPTRTLKDGTVARLYAVRHEMVPGALRAPWEA